MDKENEVYVHNEGYFVLVLSYWFLLYSLHWLSSASASRVFVLQICAIIPCIHNAVLFIHREECYYALCRKMEETGDHIVKQNRQVSQRQVLHVFSYMWNLGREQTRK
jgi:hypothetical protein